MYGGRSGAANGRISGLVRVAGRGKGRAVLPGNANNFGLQVKYSRIEPS